MENKELWFLISLVIGCAIVWLIGSFISFDMLWFIHSWVGRIIAVVMLIAIIKGAADSTQPRNRPMVCSTLLILYAPIAYFPYAKSNNFLVVTIIGVSLKKFLFKIQVFTKAFPL